MLFDRRAVCVFALLLATIYVVLGRAEAATLQLEPVSVHLTPTKRTAVLRLRNSDAEPMNVQVRAFRWTQADGEDRLYPTDALRVSPAIQSIAPGSEQFVRVLLAEGSNPAAEETYRLVIDELPQAASAPGQVRMLIRYSVPVTMRPPGLVPPALAFRVVQGPEGALLEARNAGSSSARLANLGLLTEAGATVPLTRGLVGYVLAGQLRRWPLALPAGVQLDRAAGITAHVDGKADRFAFEDAR
jgi:fimbrial chaperone protein